MLRCVCEHFQQKPVVAQQLGITPELIREQLKEEYQADPAMGEALLPYDHSPPQDTPPPPQHESLL